MNSKMMQMNNRKYLAIMLSSGVILTRLYEAYPELKKTMPNLELLEIRYYQNHKGEAIVSLSLAEPHSEKLEILIDTETESIFFPDRFDQISKEAYDER